MLPCWLDTQIMNGLGSGLPFSNLCEAPPLWVGRLVGWLVGHCLFTYLRYDSSCNNQDV